MLDIVKESDIKEIPNRKLILELLKDINFL